MLRRIIASFFLIIGIVWEILQFIATALTLPGDLQPLWDAYMADLNWLGLLILVMSIIGFTYVFFPDIWRKISRPIQTGQNVKIVGGDDRSISGPNYGGIQNTGDHVSFEDTSPRRRIRDLFSTIDARVNSRTGRMVVRMEPHHLDALRALVAEAGEESPVKVREIQQRLRGSHINNGTLGITYAADEQLAVEIEISEPLGDNPS